MKLGNGTGRAWCQDTFDLDIVDSTGETSTVKVPAPDYPVSKSTSDADDLPNMCNATNSEYFAQICVCPPGTYKIILDEAPIAACQACRKGSYRNYTTNNTDYCEDCWKGSYSPGLYAK